MTRLLAPLLLLAAVLPGQAALADPHPRASHVVAIGGAVTEIVFALGEQDRLVARDSSSVFPPEAVALLREAGVAFEPIPSGYDAAGLRARKRVMFILSLQDGRIMASGQGHRRE